MLNSDSTDFTLADFLAGPPDMDLVAECLNTLIAVTDHGGRRPKVSRSEQSVHLVAA